MEKLNLYSLKMKLNRHKLSFQILDDGSIQLGGANIGISQWLTLVVLPLSLGIILLLLTVFGIIPRIRILTLLFIGFPLGYGGYGLSLINKKKKNNRDGKLISKRTVKIITDGTEKLFTVDTIKSIDFAIEKSDNDMQQGILFLVDNNEKIYQLIGIFDKEKKYLEDDLNYFKDYFNMVIGR